MKTITKHTPGPWNFNLDRKEISANKGIPITALPITIVLGTAKMFNNKDKSIANARLIAAAPELLEALLLWNEWNKLSVKSIWNNVEDKEKDDLYLECLYRTKEAIAKATTPEP